VVHLKFVITRPDRVIQKRGYGFPDHPLPWAADQADRE